MGEIPPDREDTYMKTLRPTTAGSFLDLRSVGGAELEKTQRTGTERAFSSTLTNSFPGACQTWVEERVLAKYSST